MATTATCPECGAVLDPTQLELSFVCPGCGVRIPAGAIWGLTTTLDERIVRTDAAFQAYMRGYDETEPLDSGVD